MTANDPTPFSQSVLLGSNIGSIRTTDQGDARLARSTIFDVMRAAEDATARYMEKHPETTFEEPSLWVGVHPVNDRYISYGWNAIGKRA